LAKEEVFQIVGCAIEVLNTLGHGIIEKPSENSLVVEFGLRDIPTDCRVVLNFKRRSWRGSEKILS
jgi:uncharacterized protein YkvS